MCCDVLADISDLLFQNLRPNKPKCVSSIWHHHGPDINNSNKEEERNKQLSGNIEGRGR